MNKNTGTWVQTDRAVHEAWALLTRKPAASAVMHILCANVGEHNAVIMSQETLAALTGFNARSVARAVKILKDDKWIEVRQIGPTKTVNAYVINDRVAWTGKREGLRYSLFSATVVVNDKEQPDKDNLDEQPALIQIPSIQPGEQQLPTGPGLPPPAEPSIPGLEPDLPATAVQDGAYLPQHDPDTGGIIGE